MNSSTTRWLVLIAIAMSLYVLFVDRKFDDTTDLADARTRVLPGLSEEVLTGIEVFRGTNRVVALEKNEGEWRLTAPLPYPAQAESVERFVKTLEDLRVRSRITAAEALAQTNGLAAFGLEPPAATIALTEAGRSQSIRVGAHTPVGGQVYLQVSGQEDLLTVSDDFLKSLPESPFAWRSRRLLSLAGQDINRIEVLPATNGFEVVFSPTNQTWTLTKPLATPADAARLEYLMSQLEMTRVAGFVSDHPGDHLATYALDPPLRELVFSRGAELAGHLQIGRAATNNANFLYVRNARLGHVMLVARSAMEPWLTSFRDFCDRRLMVIPLDQVRRIEFTAEEAVALDRGTNDNWRITHPYEAPADSLLVLEFLAQLAGLEFIDFHREVANDFAADGLDPPLQSYRVLGAPTNAPPSATNQVLAELSLGLAKGNLRFARRGTENSVVTMLDPGKLPRAAWQLRSRHIWNFSTNQIEAISVLQQGATKRLRRLGPMDWTPDAGSTGGFNPLTIEETAFRLSKLRAERWVARGDDRLPLYGFPQAACRIDVELKPQDGSSTVHSLWLGRQGPAGQRYAAVRQDVPAGWVIFELPLTTQAFIEEDLVMAPLP
jgi:hypothetical protein